MNKSLVFDIEGDGLNASKIYCASFHDLNQNKSYTITDYDELRKELLGADYLICHNIIRFDVPTLERLLDIKIKAQVIDTLGLSWYLYIERGGTEHGLASWGETFGIPKPEIEDWHGLSIEEYIHRCEEDVKINVKVWKKMQSDLMELYGNKEGFFRAIRYINFKMECLKYQEQSGWKVDKDRVNEVLSEYRPLVEEKRSALAASMPKLEEVDKKSMPARPFLKDGGLSVQGLRWMELTKKNNLPFDYDGVIEVNKGWKEPNPGSSAQLKSWLYSLGWVPRTFKSSKRKDGMHEVEQINQEHGKGVCPSVLELIEVDPNVEHLAGLSVLEHRIPQLERLLKDTEKCSIFFPDGDRVQAYANGFTNTMRMKHSGLVNLPKVEKPYSGIRSALICDKGKILCGADKSSLEDRIKQHFIWPHDPEYVKSMMRDGFDPHMELARFAKTMTQAEIDLYQHLDPIENKTAEQQAQLKPLAKIRSMYKNGNYACQYGAGVPRLMKTIGCDQSTAKSVHEAYWGLNWAIKKVASEQKYKTIKGKMWLWNPISKLWYYLKKHKDIFSTLVQGTAAYVFDLWLGLVLKERPQLNGQFHDEFIIEIKDGMQEECTKLLRKCLDKTNEILKLNRELDIDIKFGYRYSEIH